MKKKKTFNYSFDLQQSLQVHSLEQLMDTAINLHKRGDLLQAEQLYRRILQLQPAHDYTLNLLGVLVSQKGDHQEGEKLFARAITIDPTVADYHNNLGLARQQQGKLPEAAQSFRQAIQINPEYTQAWWGLGNVSVEMEVPQTAIDAYQKAISISPDFLPAYNNLGNVYSTFRLYAKAHQVLDKVIELKPDFAEAWYNIGVVYMAEKKGAEAICAFDQAVALKPDYFKAYSKRGYCKHILLDDIEGALHDFDHAINLNSSYVPAYLAKADIYRQKEDFDKAEEILHGVLISNASSVDTGRLDGLNANRLQYNHHDSYMYKHIGNVHFMLGDIFDKQGDYDKALTHYKEANSSHGKLVVYNHDAHEKTINALMKVFSADFFAEFSALGTEEELPIIITGLSRSGKTLTEGSITRHAHVMAGGELGYFSRVAQAPDFFFDTDVPWPFCCHTLNADSAQKLIEQYLELLRGSSSTARFVTDTSPGNYLFFGLIRLLFPQAPLIYCRRDPLDLCLSIYFKGYQNINYHRYSNDLMNIGHYYLQYARLMAHWRKVLPGPPIVESRYEELTGNFEAHSRRLMQCCGLEFDASSERSSLQKPDDAGVNYGHDQQPIHNTYVHFSKHYEEFLEPLKEIIASAEY